MLPTKRKNAATINGGRKRAKIVQNADNLPWKTVKRPQESGIAGDDGILELEEIENVQVIYDGGSVKFNVIEQQERNILPGPGSQELVSFPEIKGFDSAELLPNWHAFGLNSQLNRTLFDKQFLSPTNIQAAAIPLALSGRDIVGISQTGSGKTLAYGLPILHQLLSHPTRTVKRKLRALILAPTRELALQVSSHLNACLNVLQEGSSTTKPPPIVSVAAIVGGMSAQKQKRVLDRGVDVLVATPGRLWDLMEHDDDLSLQIKNLRFLVLDEADRMIEAGHFAELDNILRLTLRFSKEDEIEAQSDSEDTKEGVAVEPMQTFVFSATLSKDLQRNVKKHSRPKPVSGKKSKAPASTLDDLLLRLDFRDPEPEVIDLSPKGGAVSTLTESKIECLSSDKDVYLYYFLLRYPGRTLVFLSSIDTIRRLLPLFTLLKIPAFPLHSQLEQRQRLKNLDAFNKTKNGVLLATDVAARGLDIAAVDVANAEAGNGVDHVIHYQIPRTADSYVHRNGRTARAERKGFSMLMCAPDERKVVRALLGSLGRDEASIPEIAIDLKMMDKLKTRVQIARKIEQTQHKIKKENHERNWMKVTAEAMEIELGSDFMSSDDDEKPSEQRRKAKSAKNDHLKAELKKLLAQPLLASGVSARYITGGSRAIVDGLLAGGYNESMIGLETAKAGSELVTRKRADSKKKDVVKVQKSISVENDEEEWGGILTT